MRRALLAGVLAGAVVVAAGCGASQNSGSSSDSMPDSGSAVDTTMPIDAGDTTIKWSPCADDDTKTLQCAKFRVPFDWNDPDVGTFVLPLVKRPADTKTARIGSMLVNPGGPGFGGSYLAQSAESFFSEELLQRFDIVAWDPRGTGDSEPAVDCVDDYDPYFAIDPTPDSEEERRQAIDAAQSFADKCEQESGKILPYISTNATARDMNAIRRALDESQITYFGFSYGSELGATWATMFPDTVRAAVLDGATDPDADFIQSGLDQAKGFETEFGKFLQRCASNLKCPFYNGGKPAAAFDALITKLDETPLVVSKNRAPVNQAVAYTAVVQAMYSSTLWDELEIALANAQKGDGAGLLSLNDQYYQRNNDGTYGNELEAFNAISCVDDPGPKTVEEATANDAKFKAVAPRLYGAFIGGYGCVFWPAKADRRINITGIGAGPVVVIGTTGDAATPLASSRKMAEKLEDGRLVVVTGNRHTGYGANECVVEAVDRYLITTKVSFREKAC